MKIAYFGNPQSIHDAKWVNFFSNKYQIIMITHIMNDKKGMINSATPIYSILPESYSSFSIKRNIDTIKRIKKVLSHHQIDVIHTLYAFPNVFWASKCDIPHIISTRGSDILIDYKKLFNPKALKQKITFKILRKEYSKCFKDASFITSTSINQNIVIKTMVSDIKKLFIVRTGIDINKIENYDTKIRIDKTSLRIFCPRSMAPVYNHEFVIQSLGLLKKYYPKVCFDVTFINDTPKSNYTKRIRNMIKDVGIDENTKFKTFQNQELMFKEYGENDIVISVPHSDGTPNSCLEAMAMKRPIFVSPLDYDKDIFNNDTVTMIEPFEPNQLMYLIHKFNVAESKKEFMVKVENAYDAVKEFGNIKDSLNIIEKLYKDTIIKPSV